jgi:hypothetical protein
LRERVKVVCLGVLYGMAAPTLAALLGIAPVEAVELLQKHRRTYPAFLAMVRSRRLGRILAQSVVVGFRLAGAGDCEHEADIAF